MQDAVDRYEQTTPQPWTIDGSSEFLDRLVQMIVGFHIEIDRVEGKWKLSQNHSAERRERVIRGLLDSADAGSHDVARLMRETLGVPDSLSTLVSHRPHDRRREHDV